MALAGDTPDIFHSDQWCQFTSVDFVTRLQADEINLNWSVRKQCYDNILVERLWRTDKYEEVYLHAYIDVEILLSNATQLTGMQNSP